MDRDILAFLFALYLALSWREWFNPIPEMEIEIVLIFPQGISLINTLRKELVLPSPELSYSCLPLSYRRGLPILRFTSRAGMESRKSLERNGGKYTFPPRTVYFPESSELTGAKKCVKLLFSVKGVENIAKRVVDQDLKSKSSNT